jgi:hypothetical protein
MDKKCEVKKTCREINDIKYLFDKNWAKKTKSINSYKNIFTKISHPGWLLFFALSYNAQTTITRPWRYSNP